MNGVDSPWKGNTEESQGGESLVGCCLWGRTESDTLWVKAQHEGALPPPCIVRKDPRVPHTIGKDCCWEGLGAEGEGDDRG